jgi:hypothetical protein
MAINPMMFPAFMGMGGQQAPQMQQPMAPQQMQQPQQQTPDSLADFTRLLSGDLSGSLSSGDKLLALSGLLNSATRSGRRAGLTPQQVIGDLQKQKVAEMQNRMAVEQLRAQEAQRQQQEQAMSSFVSTLSQEKQALFPGLDAEGKSAMLKEHLSPQPFQIVKSGGENFMVFRDKSRVKLDIPPDVETEKIDTGDKILIVDKNSGETLREYDMKMSPAQVATNEVARGNLAIRQAEFRRGPSGGSGGGGRSSKQPVQITVNGKKTFGVPLGGFQYQLADGRTVTATPDKSSSGFAPQFPPPATSGRRF